MKLSVRLNPLLFAVVLSTAVMTANFRNEALALDSDSDSPASILAPNAVKGRQAEVKLQYAEWAKLKPGAFSYGDSSKYHWKEVPAGLEGVRWSRHPMHAATLRFEVTQPGVVFMAITSRFTKSGKGGDWEKELVTLNELQEKGWRKLSGFEGLHNTEAGVDWIILYKPCVAGEFHSYRTEKYVAPILLMR